MNQSQQARRAFLRGSLKRPPTGIRPPWTHNNFAELCSRCDDCLDVCEENIIVRGDGGFPSVDFSRGGCTYCEKCRDLTDCKAFTRESSPPWVQSITFNDHCLSARGVVCRACGDACDSRAILFQLKPGGIAEPKIQTDNCNGCGFCIAVCPENAILMEVNI